MCNNPRILVALKAECSPVIMLRVLSSETSKINLHDFGTQSRDAVVGGPYMLITHNEKKRKKISNVVISHDGGQESLVCATRD